ncbi:MAG: hypothetical protein HOP29_17660 [Phycisphaerales bacterium]|nr:hypothetical protein [Phycisphaerales bacterium]
MIDVKPAARTIDDIRLSDRDRLVIREAAAVLRERFPVKRIVLYGSKARGDDDRDSDVDLLVLMDHDMNMTERGEVISAIYPVQMKHMVMLSPLIIGEDEWENGVYQVLPIHDEIDRDGVLV